MMKDLLEKNFVSHYKLDKYNTVNVVSTKDADFDLVDDVKLVHPSGEERKELML